MIYWIFMNIHEYSIIIQYMSFWVAGVRRFGVDLVEFKHDCYAPQKWLVPFGHQTFLVPYSTSPVPGLISGGYHFFIAYHIHGLIDL